MNILVKMQIDKIKKMNKYNMKNINEVSRVATDLKLSALIKQLYIDPNEYLNYINKKNY